jgi:hypothetical protein
MASTFSSGRVGWVGSAAGMLLLVFPLGLATRILIGWDIGITVYEGAIALLVLTTAATMATLAAVVAELGQARGPYQIYWG